MNLKDLELKTLKEIKEEAWEWENTAMDYEIANESSLRESRKTFDDDAFNNDPLFFTNEGKVDDKTFGYVKNGEIFYEKIDIRDSVFPNFKGDK